MGPLVPSQRSRQGVGILNGFQDQPVALDNLINALAGPESQPPDGFRGDRGLKGP
jgi:hypothetical protein